MFVAGILIKAFGVLIAISGLIKSLETQKGEEIYKFWILVDSFIIIFYPAILFLRWKSRKLQNFEMTLFGIFKL